eukprot:2538853-Rhodomonas_salina.5
MPGPDVLYGAGICPVLMCCRVMVSSYGVCYAVDGTDVLYGATRRPWSKLAATRHAQTSDLGAHVTATRASLSRARPQGGREGEGGRERSEREDREAQRGGAIPHGPTVSLYTIVLCIFCVLLCCTCANRYHPTPLLRVAARVPAGLGHRAAAECI